MMRLPRAWPILIAIALLWAVSLALPALSAGGRGFSGFELLAQGWQGAPRGVYAWFANPLFGAALVSALLARDGFAMALSGVATLLGATSIFVEPALRERMASVPEIELRVGFYVWMIALAALCLHSLTRALSSRRRMRGEARVRQTADSGKSRD